MAMSRCLRVHLVYSVTILMLLIVIGVQSFPRVWEKTIRISGKDNQGGYTLRMLASGDLVFEKHRFLPLASLRDYWGELSVASVQWVEDRKVLVRMTDGTQLTITLGNIEVAAPDGR